ncbi:MAG: methyltransferase domain-containing protein [Bacteroidales bacterium]|nr:methyltransferase domain-containing protein [Bacteroidales bacterium]
MMIPDWQLPPGVDRGLWDYLHSDEMVAGYDAQIAASPLATADLAFCTRWLSDPGKLLDLGCGTGRLCVEFARKGFECVGVDLSSVMLAKARENAATAGVQVEFREGNLVYLAEWPDQRFDAAACLFSTLGMIRGAVNRHKVIGAAYRVIRPGGRFILHIHNRWYRGLGGKRRLGQMWQTLRRSPTAGDITMPQAYGGAPLTLHHFTRREILRLLTSARFRIEEVEPIRVRRSIYGWLIACTRPS